eukprot:superscaffoldBa00000168_g2371
MDRAYPSARVVVQLGIFSVWPLQIIRASGFLISPTPEVRAVGAVNQDKEPTQQPKSALGNHPRLSAFKTTMPYAAGQAWARAFAECQWATTRDGPRVIIPRHSEMIL